MTRDYGKQRYVRPQAPKKEKKQQEKAQRIRHRRVVVSPKTPRTGWLWGGLLACGVAVGAIGYWYHHRSMAPVEASSTVADKKTPAVNSAKEGKGVSSAQAVEPRFQFYTLLPEQNKWVPLNEKEVEAALPPSEHIYFIQLAAFAKLDVATGFSQRLEKIHLHPHLETVVTASNRTWYRVILGPFETKRAAERTRRQLIAEGFDAGFVRQRSRSQVTAESTQKR